MNLCFMYVHAAGTGFVKRSDLDAEDEEEEEEEDRKVRIAEDEEAPEKVSRSKKRQGAVLSICALAISRGS